METQPDFRELLALFNAHHVKYLIVGGYALAFHGAPRFTGDLDIFVQPEMINAQRIVTALEAFGFASVGLTPGDFAYPDQVIQLGVPPVRIDLITSITGVSWAEAWAGRIAGNYGDIPVSYIGRAQFVANKRAALLAERRTWPIWKGLGRCKVRSYPAPNQALEATGHSARFWAGVGWGSVARTSAWALAPRKESRGRPIQEYVGSCHCGAVCFQIETDFPELTMCDRSICRRKNTLMVQGYERN